MEEPNNIFDFQKVIYPYTSYEVLLSWKKSST